MGLETSLEGVSHVAARWVARVGAEDAGAEDWHALTAWLELDPAHARAFDAAALLDAELTAHAPALAAMAAANDDTPVSSPLWRQLRRPVAAVAAALLAGALLWTDVAHRDPPALATHTTGARETATLRLDAGATARLDRATRLAVAANGQRVELATGAAYFDVKHDPARPFKVTLGDYEVRDVGTRFEVARTPARITVAVAQGEVTLAPTGGGVGLHVGSGERIDLSIASGAAERRQIDPTSVASWRMGVLRYRAAPLALVAGDLARYSTRPVLVDPAIARLRFSGVLPLDDGARMAARVAGVLRLRVVSVNGDAMLVPGGGSARGDMPGGS